MSYQGYGRSVREVERLILVFFVSRLTVSLIYRRRSSKHSLGRKVVKGSERVRRS